MLSVNQLKLKTVAVIAVSMLTTACGQNANVAKSAPPATVSGSQLAQGNTAGTPQTNVPNPPIANNNPPSKNSTPSGEPGTVGNDPRVDTGIVPNFPSRQNPRSRPSTPSPSVGNPPRINPDVNPPISAPSDPVAHQPRQPLDPVVTTPVEPSRPSSPTPKGKLLAEVIVNDSRPSGGGGGRVTEIDATVVIPKRSSTPGPAGRDGRDGNDGLHGCKVETYSKEFAAVEMEPAEYAGVELPYKSSAEHEITTATLGYSTPKAKGGIKTENRYVKDTQVMFKFNVNLPPRLAIKRILNAYLVFDSVKVSVDDWEDTEFFCFIDQKICSGYHFRPEETTWQNNINQAFWGVPEQGDATPSLNAPFNTTFVELLKKSLIETSGRYRLWSSDRIPLYMDDLLKGGKIYKEGTLSFLYNGSAEDQRLNKAFRAVVADDTRLGPNTKFVIEYEEDTCKTIQLEQQAAQANTKAGS